MSQAYFDTYINRIGETANLYAYINQIGETANLYANTDKKKK